MTRITIKQLDQTNKEIQQKTEDITDTLEKTIFQHNKLAQDILEQKAETWTAINNINKRLSEIQEHIKRTEIKYHENDLNHRWKKRQKYYDY